MPTLQCIHTMIVTSDNVYICGIHIFNQKCIHWEYKTHQTCTQYAYIHFIVRKLYLNNVTFSDSNFINGINLKILEDIKMPKENLEGYFFITIW